MLIICYYTNDDLVKRFTNLTASDFEMSMMGELKFFRGLPVSQEKEGTRIYKQKCPREMLKKSGLESVKPISTPCSPNESLGKDEHVHEVNQTLYRGMIGLLLYIMASRPDILFTVCFVLVFQANPRETHLKVVIRILRYLKGA